MSNTQAAFSIEELRSVFRYDQETGHIFWIEGTRRSAPGSFAGFIGMYGYIAIPYKMKSIRAHRLAWALHYGEWPAKHIDHINGIRTDNKIGNLREATFAENNWNRPKPSNNTSGHKGVTFHKGEGKYYARITANKINRSLGYFDTAEEAGAAYQLAAKEYHGEFANHWDYAAPQQSEGSGNG